MTTGAAGGSEPCSKTPGRYQDASVAGGVLSVCEYITSGFCCFSIGGMEITLTVKVSQSLKLCSTSDRVFSYTVFLVNTWLS